MTFSAPRTWATGLVVTAGILNTEIRDNLLALSVHGHSGAAGDGDDVLTGVDSATFDDISDPAAPGAAKTVIWTNTGKLHQRAGAAGVAEEFSVNTHSHSVSQTGQSVTRPGTTNEYHVSSEVLGASYGHIQSAPARVFGGTGKRGAAVMASASCTTSITTADQLNTSIRIRMDAVEKASYTTSTYTVTASSQAPQLNISVLHLEPDVSAASHTFDAQLKRAQVSGTPTVNVHAENGSPADGQRSMTVIVSEINNGVP